MVGLAAHFAQGAPGLRLPGTDDTAEAAAVLRATNIIRRLQGSVEDRWDAAGFPVRALLDRLPLACTHRAHAGDRRHFPFIQMSTGLWNAPHRDKNDCAPSCAVWVSVSPKTNGGGRARIAWFLLPDFGVRIPLSVPDDDRICVSLWWEGSGIRHCSFTEQDDDDSEEDRRLPSLVSLFLGVSRPTASVAYRTASVLYRLIHRKETLRRADLAKRKYKGGVPLVGLWFRRVPDKGHANVIFPLLYVEDEGEFFVPVVVNGVSVRDTKYGIVGKVWMRFGETAQFLDGKWARKRVLVRKC